MINSVAHGDIKVHPPNYGVPDIASLISSTDLFARKFDATEDEIVLAMFEQHLTTGAANSYFSAMVDTPSPKAHLRTTMTAGLINRFRFNDGQLLAGI